MNDNSAILDVLLYVLGVIAALFFLAECLTSNKKVNKKQDSRDWNNILPEDFDDEQKK